MYDHDDRPNPLDVLDRDERDQDARDPNRRGKKRLLPAGSAEQAAAWGGAA